MSRGRLITFAVLAVVLLVAFATNPSPDRHRVKLREAAGDRNPLARVPGVGVMTELSTGYHSLGVASYTTVGNRIVSWGVFGVVFVKS
ncbi:hypothetical protein WG902_08145 [Ramlibacter sp. PS3R-8]|uniref:hypothetical protein n=1 Tax=Ramlibacter sp. PS3R-8 TaxID=3133437 RepID=UPI00309C4B43